jgi:proton glutamate symport protein
MKSPIVESAQHSPNEQKQSHTLTIWILVALVAGVAFGHFFPEAGKQMRLFGQIFLRLIRSVIAPLVFSTLVVGITGIGSIRTMGRLGGKAILYFEVVTTIALFVGLGAAHLVQPGLGVQLQKGQVPTLPAQGTSLQTAIEHAIPTSIFDAMARGEVLQIVVFAMMFGVACTAIGPRAKTMVDFCESLAEVMFQFTHYVMYVAPFGVFGAMASAVGEHGLGVLVNLGKLVATLYGSLIFFVIFVFGTVAVIAKVPIRRFLGSVRDPFMIAFSTTSSEAALPKALENMVKFGVPRHIVAFVLPTGYSFNLDGSTLYLSLAAMFVAQAAGVHLPLGTQITMMLTLMLTTKGIAGVPRASLVILSGTLASFNLPAEGVFVILAVDELMDMARTSVNLLGNCLATAVVARWEGIDLNTPVATKTATGVAQ